MNIPERSYDPPKCFSFDVQWTLILLQWLILRQVFAVFVGFFGLVQ